MSSVGKVVRRHTRHIETVTLNCQGSPASRCGPFESRLLLIPGNAEAARGARAGNDENLRRLALAVLAPIVPVGAGSAPMCSETCPISAISVPFMTATLPVPNPASKLRFRASRPCWS
jgi:hypothetical protein